MPYLKLRPISTGIISTVRVPRVKGLGTDWCPTGVRVLLLLHSVVLLVPVPYPRTHVIPYFVLRSIILDSGRVKSILLGFFSSGVRYSSTPIFSCCFTPPEKSETRNHKFCEFACAAVVVVRRTAVRSTYNIYAGYSNIDRHWYLLLYSN